MSFSTDVKEILSKTNNLSKKDQVTRELVGYLISANTVIRKNKIKFSTESEYNINRFSKLLKNVNIDNYEINLKGKVYSIEYKITEELSELKYEENKLFLDLKEKQEDLDKALLRGLFSGSGYINNPEKKYHLDINFNQEQNCKKIYNLLKNYNINTKTIQKENGYAIYIKDGEEISKFLAFIGANSAVLKFEEIRVIRDTNNNVNRIINCETANMTKTIKAGNKQIEDIKFIKSKKKFSILPDALKEVAEIRLKYPDASLSELVKYMNNEISKSGLTHRLSAITKIADELRKE